VDGLEVEFGEKLLVLRVDILSAPGQELSRIFSSRVTPTFIMFDAEGGEIWRQFGSIDSDKVRAFLAR